MMGKSQRRITLASLGLLVLTTFALGACRLPRQSQTPRHWVLTPIEAVRPVSEIRKSVGVGPVGFPDYLERHGVVRRSGANQLQVAQFDLWGQSLRENFTQVLARNLEILVPGVAAVSFPWKGPGQDLAYRVVVDVDRFDAGPDDHVALDALWTLHRGTSTAWVAGGRNAIRVPVEGEGTAAIVAAMSQAVGRLSREIAPHLGAAR
jgi:uncharacterized lipoprotein YmbA